MQAFIKQPKRIPFFLKLGILLSERITGKTMLPARISRNESQARPCCPRGFWRGIPKPPSGQA